MRVLLLLALLAHVAHAQGTGTIAGTVRDAATSEALVGANVRLEGTALGAATGVDGAFVVQNVPAGQYAVTVSYIGYLRRTSDDQTVAAGETRRLDAALTVDESFEEYCLGCFSVPIVDRSPFPSRTLTGDEMARLPIGR